MDNTQISQTDLVAELKQVLIGYLEPLNLTYFFAKEPLSLDELFMKHGGMPMFLYDKQPIVDKFIKNINAQVGEEKYFAKLVLKNDENDSYFGFGIEVLHNLTDNNHYTNITVHFQELVLLLAKSILSASVFVIDKENMQHVYVDGAYKKLVNHRNNSEFFKETITFETFKIKG